MAPATKQMFAERKNFIRMADALGTFFFNVFENKSGELDNVDHTLYIDSYILCTRLCVTIRL